ncbi:NeuD/PglB/VioB family sugar acetyltransferase [Halobacteriovorax sp. HLS]|uniref:NeuD/PglB/VioB family sugar acetyltransferase n=1 Tax=Halobacteriovorax sp. HLS TaxID=2234000 RepID=UPI0019D48A57|nr:NeuD/PglB/VioB family sugar acetyltransferase [Halobacteriovorax sp. HLS]
MKKQKVILIGAGGHCKACIDVIESNSMYEIVGIVDNNVKDDILGYPILGTDENLKDLIKQYRNVCITVGQIKSPEVRKRLFTTASQLGASFPTFISSRAYVSKYSTIGQGCIVMHGATIQANSIVGENCIINDHSLVEHDCTVGRNCHISTGALINGGVSVGDDTFIGSRAVIFQSVSIGEKVVVGAGVVVKENIADGVMLK